MRRHAPIALLLWMGLLLAACSAETTATLSPQPPTPPEPDAQPTSAREPASKYADLEIVTLLPPDAIPSIDRPQFLSAEDANAFYSPDELVIGVEFDGEARAYSVPFLSSHEIVNDSISGRNIAVTW